MDLKEIKEINLRRFLSEKYGLKFNEKGYAIYPFHPDEKNPSNRFDNFAYGME